MTRLDLASWQRDDHLRPTRFFGTLPVINIAVGVVTGLVQEFQFGMDWSAYSRFVGDAADELLELVDDRLEPGHLGGDHELV